MSLDIHVHSAFHSQPSEEINGDLAVQPAQKGALEGSIPADKVGACVSVKTFPLYEFSKREILFFIGHLVNAKHSFYHA